MNKIVLAVVISATLSISSVAIASSQTVTLGYAHSKVQDLNNINGVNVKYRFEGQQAFGVITSFSYQSGNHDRQYFVDRDLMTDKIDIKSYSLAAGPAYRLNEIVSIYGLLGASVTKVQADSHWLNYSSLGYEDMGIIKYSKNSVNAMYGAGIQINPMDNLALDIAYEGTRFKANDKNYTVNGFNVGVGYRF